ncbi:lamin tail domain-containing protein [Brumimicrobium mesophilum]|uniref:lamin tail domain-containing protein n=1 Tax=Brumimicrobium mesophilum TaxID=392717 RepID=UPI000D13FE56|nr:lamin tail domain-containing protein [Brumimicrobium mesophilum]
MKHLFFIFCSFFTFSCWSQMTDSFDDGDFTNNPTWVGDVADFIVNANNELQLDAAAAGDSYLSTPHNLTQLEDREWRFSIDYGFSPSDNNRGNTYLTASSSDLSTDPDGIYFRIGENLSNDPIELIERSGGVETTILTSTPGIVAASFDISVKIIYNANGDWELFLDLAGGNNYVLDASANYPATVLGQHLGIWLKYTSSNVDRFTYDDFYAGPIQVDNVPPTILSVSPISSTELEVLFDEGIDQSSGEVVSNYVVDNGIGNPISVQQDATNLALFTLNFATPFNVGDVYSLTTSNVEDVAGNPMTTQNETFQYVVAQTPEFGDIIINEFLADESPVVGLPEVEFVELYNRSNKYFHLDGWKLSDNNTSGTIQDVWLLPGEYLILVPSSGITDYPQATIVSSWASLNNSGDDIELATDGGIVVDKISYTDEWYNDEMKEDGGWSIERINPDLACSSKDNWSASVDLSGGTPGIQNSVYENAPDTQSPTVIGFETELPNRLKIKFSEGMDSLSLENAIFTSTPALNISTRILSEQYPSEIILEFVETINPGELYSFEINNFSDCSGNTNSYSGTFVVPQVAEKGDLIINEILFNPLTGGADFVEIYNNSDKYIDLLDWELGNIDDEEVANLKQITKTYILEPNDYVVLTTDSNFQLMNYPFAIPGKFLQMASLPSYNNDSSTVYLVFNDTIMDKVSYSDEWHFSLINDDKGVSLERFSADEPSNSESNWHSASETVGFATPGRVNSQAMKPNQEGGTLSLSSKSFSPDGDGFEDVLLLTYEVSSPDLLGDLIIYDDKGRVIKTLFKRELLGGTGTVKWEGTREDGTKASIGPYIIMFDVFNLDSSKTQTVRKVVTLAGRL